MSINEKTKTNGFVWAMLTCVLALGGFLGMIVGNTTSNKAILEGVEKRVDGLEARIEKQLDAIESEIKILQQTQAKLSVQIEKK